MRHLSRFIPGEEIDAVSQWNFAAVDTESLRLQAQARLRRDAADEARDEALRQQAYAEGFAQGQASAVLRSEQQLTAYIDNQGRQAAQRFGQLLASAQEQLGQSQQVMAQGVLELACELARQVVRQELSVNPNALLPVIREGLGMLADDCKSAVVRLNAVDLEALQDAVQAEFAGLALTWIADNTIEPGGCVISSAGAVVDGSLKTRWRRVVAKLGLSVAWED